MERFFSYGVDGFSHAVRNFAERSNGKDSLCFVIFLFVIITEISFILEFNYLIY